MYENVERTLATLGFRDACLELFIENEVDDSAVQYCFAQPELIVCTLAEILRPVGRIAKFLATFSELNSSAATNGILEVSTSGQLSMGRGSCVAENVQKNALSESDLKTVPATARPLSDGTIELSGLANHSKCEQTDPIIASEESHDVSSLYEINVTTTSELVNTVTNGTIEILGLAQCSELKQPVQVMTTQDSHKTSSMKESDVKTTSKSATTLTIGTIEHSDLAESPEPRPPSISMILQETHNGRNLSTSNVNTTSESVSNVTNGNVESLGLRHCSDIQQPVQIMTSVNSHEVSGHYKSNVTTTSESVSTFTNGNVEIVDLRYSSELKQPVQKINSEDSQEVSSLYQSNVTTTSDSLSTVTNANVEILDLRHCSDIQQPAQIMTSVDSHEVSGLYESNVTTTSESVSSVTNGTVEILGLAQCAELTQPVQVIQIEDSHERSSMNESDLKTNAKCASSLTMGTTEHSELAEAPVHPRLVDIMTLKEMQNGRSLSESTVKTTSESVSSVTNGNDGILGLGKTLELSRMVQTMNTQVSIEANMYEWVERTLEAFGYRELYIKLFMENEVDDSVVQYCLAQPTLIVWTFKGIIRPVGRIAKFLAKFSELISAAATNGTLDIWTSGQLSTRRKSCVAEDVRKIKQYGSDLKTVTAPSSPLNNGTIELSGLTQCSELPQPVPIITSQEYHEVSSFYESTVKSNSESVSNVTNGNVEILGLRHCSELMQPVQMMISEDSHEVSSFYESNVTRTCESVSTVTNGTVEILGLAQCTDLTQPVQVMTIQDSHKRSSMNESDVKTTSKSATTLNVGTIEQSDLAEAPESPHAVVKTMIESASTVTNGTIELSSLEEAVDLAQQGQVMNLQESHEGCSLNERNTKTTSELSSTLSMGTDELSVLVQSSLLSPLFKKYPESDSLNKINVQIMSEPVSTLTVGVIEFSGLAQANELPQSIQVTTTQEFHEGSCLYESNMKTTTCDPNVLPRQGNSIKMYENIERTLEALRLPDAYMQLFIDKQVDDSAVQDCLANPTLRDSTLAGIIRTRRRAKFMTKFSELISAAAKNGTPEVSTSGRLSMEWGSSVAEDVSQNSPYQSDMKTPSESASILTNRTIELLGSDEPPELPHPVQIMNFQEPGEGVQASGVQFYSPNLEKILRKTGGRPLGVLAIAGPTRKGKSFFLNYVLRYLTGLTENNQDWMGWERKEDPLVGFPWQTSSDRITTGIWMWSEPITMKSADGQEYDILLMDTQGVYDEHTSPHQWSILVGLGLISSSCLIFNLSSDLQEDQLNIFDKFMQFGLLALQDQTDVTSDNIETPFQKLIFLIRDWPSEQQHPFGFAGGKSFIQKKLEIKVSHMEAHRRVREQLGQCFEEVTCCLLPLPGPAAFEFDYNGATVNCETYLAQLEACISKLMNPKAFPIKKLNGNHLTGQDLLDHFTIYCKLLNSDEMPSSESLFDATSRSCHSIVINKCIEAVQQDLQQKLASRQFFKDQDLVLLEKAIQEKALQIYASCKKMGTKESIEHSKQDLIARISAQFESVKLSNANKRVKAVSTAKETAIESYKARMQDNLSHDFSPIDVVETVSKKEEDSAMKLFAQLCGSEDSEEFPTEKARLARSLKQKLDEFQKSNIIKRLQAEKQLKDEVDRLASNYKHEMEFKTDGNITSGAELRQMHKKTWQKCIHCYSNLKLHPLLSTDGKENLKKKVDAYFQDIKTCCENIQMAGDQLQAQALKDYRTEMRKKIGIKSEEFEQMHCELKEAVMKGMKTSDRIKSKKCMELCLKKLDTAIKDAYLELHKELLELRKNSRHKRQGAKMEASSKYAECMGKLFEDGAQSPIEEIKLQTRHNYAQSEALTVLKKLFEGLHHNCRDVEEEVALSEELSEDVMARYRKFQEDNKLRWDNFEYHARESLSTIKKGYLSSLRAAAEDAFEEAEFVRNTEEAQRDCKSRLGLRIDTNVAKPDFLEGLQQELDSYIQTEFDNLLPHFRMKQDEDRIHVQAAFVEATKYYNDQMEKIIQEKDWYPPDVLFQKSNDKADAAIKSCKEDVELTDHQEKQLREHMKNLFVKYENANYLRFPSESYSVGIDLGTTYSCVAVYMNKQVKVIECDGKATIPSVVAFNDDHRVSVGQVAKDQYFRYPESTIFDAKRLIGRKFNDRVVQEDMKLWPFTVIGDENDQPKLKVRGMELRPEQISAKILASLKREAEKYLHKPVLNAVVTVPAYFGDAQRQATRDAADIAGLKIIILNEPTAAAIAYGLDAADDIQKNVLIFDLGGGTFDVAVLQMKGRQIDVKATGGDTHLGGEDFDNLMVQHIIDHVLEKDKIDLGRDRDSKKEFKKRKAFERLGRIRRYCEEHKRYLSATEKTCITIDRIDEDYDLHLEFTRDLFEQLNMPGFVKCISLMEEVLKASTLDKSAIDDIVLVGGSTRIPKIQEMIREFFGGKELSERINPDEAVARGAAIRAALLNGKQAMELGERLSLSDVAPLPLGIEVVSGELSVVIQKNTPVPCVRSKIFLTVEDNQTAINFKVYEGEKPMAVDNNFLGKFLLSNIPKAPEGAEPIDVDMSVDAEGILHVQAVCKSSQSTNSIDIETYNGRMTHSEISKARRDGLFTW